MNYKEFLKPNLGKILIFIIIISLSCSIGIKKENWSPQELIALPCISTDLNPIFWWPYYLAYNDFHFCILEITGESLSDKLIQENPILLGITLIYWYLLSCIIFSVYKKLRGKKRK